MANSIFEKTLEGLLLNYMELSESEIDYLIEQPNYSSKERIATIKNLKVVIYSNDHNPPHFHVVSNDYDINAKFRTVNLYWQHHSSSLVAEIQTAIIKENQEGGERPPLITEGEIRSYSGHEAEEKVGGISLSERTIWIMGI